MRIDILQILSYPNSQVSSFRLPRTITTFLLLFLLGNMQGWGASYTFNNVGAVLYNDKKTVSVDYEIVNGGIRIVRATTLNIGNLVIPDYFLINGISYPVTSIGSEAFQMKGIGPKLVLPKTLLTLDASCFESNNGITEVVINSQLRSWGNNAFHRCYKIRKVYNNDKNSSTNGIPGVIFSATFESEVFENAQLYVPAGTEHYYSYAYWLEYIDKTDRATATAVLGPWFQFMKVGTTGFDQRPVSVAFNFTHPNVTFSYPNNLDFAMSKVEALNANGLDVTNDLKLYKIVSNGTDENGDVNEVRAVQINGGSVANYILEKNKGIMLSGTPSYTYYITAYFDAGAKNLNRADLSGNLMVGNGDKPIEMLPTEDKQRYFIYTLKKYGEMFYESESGIFPAYHAYLDLGPRKSVNAKFLSLVFQPQLTNAIENTSHTTTNSLYWYNLYGLKMAGKPNKRGIYIYNGKKAVIK